MWVVRPMIASMDDILRWIDNWYDTFWTRLLREMLDYYNMKHVDDVDFQFVLIEDFLSDNTLKDTVLRYLENDEIWWDKLSRRLDWNEFSLFELFKVDIEKTLSLWEYYYDIITDPKLLISFVTWTKMIIRYGDWTSWKIRQWTPLDILRILSMCKTKDEKLVILRRILKVFYHHGVWVNQHLFQRSMFEAESRYFEIIDSEMSTLRNDYEWIVNWVQYLTRCNGNDLICKCFEVISPINTEFIELLRLLWFSNSIWFNVEWFDDNQINRKIYDKFVWLFSYIFNDLFNKFWLDIVQKVKVFKRVKPLNDFYARFVRQYVAKYSEEISLRVKWFNWDPEEKLKKISGFYNNIELWQAGMIEILDYWWSLESDVECCFNSLKGHFPIRYREACRIALDLTPDWTPAREKILWLISWMEDEFIEFYKWVINSHIPLISKFNQLYDIMRYVIKDCKLRYLIEDYFLVFVRDYIYRDITNISKDDLITIRKILVNYENYKFNNIFLSKIFNSVHLPAIIKQTLPLKYSSNVW